MSDEAADKAKIVTVSEGFFVRQAVDNIAWIDLGEYAIVVDALEHRELEAEVFEAISSTLGDKPIRYVLNTHTHYDHTALNEAFQRRYDAEIVNQRTSPIQPEGRWFEGSQRRALILPVGGTHTAEDCVIWVPQDRVLFTGDIFGWGLIPVMNLKDQKVRLLLETYGRLIEFDAAVVVPGHGPLCATGELKRWVEYFDWLYQEVRQACERGKSDQQIMRETPSPADMKTWWRFEQWKYRDGLDKVLRAVRNERRQV